MQNSVNQEKTHQNLSDLICFYSKKDLKLVGNKQIFSSEKIINSGNCIYDYVHSFFGDYFHILPFKHISIFSIFCDFRSVTRIPIWIISLIVVLLNLLFFFTCIAYEHAKLWLKVISAHTFLVFEISYVWFPN